MCKNMDNYFRYSNQKCPVCENEFLTTDDIVVCPLCGTPHHRDCYKKNGECGNYDKHSEGFRWAPEEVNLQQPEQPESEQQDAPEQPPINPFFGANPLSQFPQELEEGVSTEEVAGFVQIHAIKYLSNFFYTKSNKKTFSWAAFFFTPYWFFY